MTKQRKWEKEYYSPQDHKPLKAALEAISTGDKSKIVDIFKAHEYALARQLLCNGFEGDMTHYWAELVSHNKKEAGVNYFHEVPVMENGLVVLKDVEDYDDEEKTRWKLDRNAVDRGIEVMIDKYWWHTADALSENDDSITGDVFIQCCVFGEIVYG